MALLLIDSVAYSSKPSSDIVEFTNRWGAPISQPAAISLRIARQRPVELTPTQLADRVSRGYTFCPSTFYGQRRRDELFEQSQLMALDFDCGLPTGGWHQQPNLVYESFSHTESNPKYRAVWFLKQQITQIELYKSKLKSLMSLYSNCDKATADSCRLFYGSTANSIQYVSDTTVLDIDQLPHIVETTKLTTAANFVDDTESKQAQRDILFKLKRENKRRYAYLVAKIKGELESVTNYKSPQPGRSRYAVLWNTTANLCMEPELVPSVIASYVIAAAESNPYFAAEWDKSIQTVVQTAVDWSNNNRG